MDARSPSTPAPTVNRANQDGGKSRRKKSHAYARSPTPGIRSPSSGVLPDRAHRASSGTQMAPTAETNRTIREPRSPTPGNRSPSSGALPDRAHRASSGTQKAPTAETGRKIRKPRSQTPGNRKRSSGVLPVKAYRSTSGARAAPPVTTVRTVRDKRMPKRATDDATPTAGLSPSTTGGSTHAREKDLQSQPTPYSSTVQAVDGDALKPLDGHSDFRKKDSYAGKGIPAPKEETDSTPYDRTLGPSVQQTTSATLSLVRPSESTGIVDNAASATKGADDKQEGSTVCRSRGFFADGPSTDLKSGLEPELTPFQPNKRRSLSFLEVKHSDAIRVPLTTTVRPTLDGPTIQQARVSQQAAAPAATEKPRRGTQQAQASYYLSMKDLAASHQSDSQARRFTVPHVPYGPVRFHWTMALPVATVLLIAALFFLSPLWGRRASVGRIRGTCTTDECNRVADMLAKSLNRTEDPCVDFDSFVCSRWKPRSEFISNFEIEMNRIHMRRVADLLLNGKPHFSASAKSTRFIRKCTGQTENQEKLKALTDFADRLGIPWPYNKTAGDSINVNPLLVVFELSVRWGIYIWFDAIFRALGTGRKAQRAFHIQVTDKPSAWLNFVRTLERNNARERYYQDFCRLYHVECQSGTELQRLFNVESAVLLILDNAIDRGRNRIAKMKTKKLADLTLNVTLEEWTALVKVHAPEFHDPRQFPFYFSNAMLPVAINDIFYTHRRADIMEHLAWRFVQQHTVLGSPRGLLIFAGNSESAAKLMSIHCYNMASEKLGILLAAESAVSLFTAAERQRATSLLKNLTDLAINTVNLLPWSENGRRYVASKMARLDVVMFPENLENLDEDLSYMYSGFLDMKQHSNDSLLDYWLDATEALQNLNDTSYEFMQFRWRTYLQELIDYEYWSNQLRVSQAALEAPLFSASSAAVLRAATFGGFGALYLSRIFGIMNPSMIKADQRADMARQVGLDIMEMTLGSLECSSDFDGVLSDSVALVTAWHALKHSAPPAAKDINRLLSIGNSSFTGEQVFFLAFCLSLCDVDIPHRCNVRLNNFAPFSEAFSCPLGAPMHVPDRCGLITGLHDNLKNRSLAESHQ
ncbi:neprilysin-1-like [Dermacentor albipictus]|uniref:neprilysin-1-like n=1 Tax=Dermacentor albipictus TaxID=60249 RepID=UPI0031FDEDB1